MRPRAAALLLPLLLAAGCSPLSPYWRSRAADLGDAIPMSGGWGWGASISLRATALFHVGIGLSPVVCYRFGYEDRTFHGIWHEYSACFPWAPFVVDMGCVPPRPRGSDLPELGSIPLVYRWEVRRDAPSGEGEYPTPWEPCLREWGRHPPNSRETSGAFIIPEDRREISWHDLRQQQGDPNPLATLGSPTRATLWEASRDGPPLPRDWGLFEGDIFLGFLGVRLGFRPVEFVDFVVGFFGVDFMGDDYQEAESSAAQPPEPPPAPTEQPAPPEQPGPDGETSPLGTLPPPPRT
ncbi:MAG TPA: hypothetical protein VFY71_00560 [Planctomycetota bacterium]|nr:hypothetical protein [Planctomycetota bacterium]